MNKKGHQKGFTLIEILIVIGLIAILAAIVLIAINPARQFALARNSQRTNDVETILNAIGQRTADNKGIFAGAGCPTIGTSATTSIDNGTGGTGVDFSACLVPTYISSMPVDPSEPAASAPSTGYQLKQDPTSQRITVCAPASETETAIAAASPAICVTR